MSPAKESEIVFTAKEKAELVDCERPSEPLGPKEVEGRTLATVVSAGTELAGYTGDSFPLKPGYAAVFEAESVGGEVSGVKPGDVLLCMGPHRSFQRGAVEGMLPVPKGLAPEHAAFARLMGVSMTTLVTTAARPPARVIVTGLGPVGHLAAQVFRASGYEVTGCEPSARRREFASSFGITDVRESVPLDDPALVEEVALVVECSGHEQAALDGCRIVRKGGEVVLVGVPWRRRTDVTAHEILHAVFHRYVVLRSGWEWELPFRNRDFARGSIFENIAGALKWLAEGRVRVDGLYAALAPGEAPDVYRRLAESSFEKLAAVFDWREPE